MKPSRFLLLFVWMVIVESRAALPGTWEVMVANARIASMHTAVTRFNTVVLLDRNNITFDPSFKPDCQINPQDPFFKPDCYSHSAILDLTTNQIRTLTIFTDTWCSSGQFLPDGTLLQTGGNDNGLKKIRKFTPCKTTSFCDWEELEDTELAEGRWYSTNQILPNGSVIIFGGRDATTVELFPPHSGGPVNFPFLTEAQDSLELDNLYPYVHLLPNGHLFVFANNESVLYDFTRNVVLKRYPQLIGGPRNYPSAGSSVMLKLKPDYSTATVVVCGGAEYGAFYDGRTDAPARRSCGRIDATGENPVWEMESMPIGRIMGDMVILPTGDVLIINGAEAGSQGFEKGSQPCLYPVLYKPNDPMGVRFTTLNPGSVARMYHATANLLPDGRVMVAGSNPHYIYNLSAEFPTELSIEAFSPEYLSPENAINRLEIVGLPERIHYGGGFHVVVRGGFLEVGLVEVNIASAPYATHSFSQGQRVVKLAVFSVGMVSVVRVPGILWPSYTYKLGCMAPPDGNVAPPGYYMVFVVNMGVPSVAQWVQLV